MRHPELLSLHNVPDLRISPGTSRRAFLVHTSCEAENNYETHLYVSDFTVSYPIGMPGITSFARVDDATLAVGCPSADSTQFALLSLKNGSEGTAWNIPFDARIEGWVLGQFFISARHSITEEKTQEDGPWTILDKLPIWEDGEGYRVKIRRQLFLCSYGGQPIRISFGEMDVRIVSTHSNSLAYAGYILGGHGRIINEIRYWAREDRLLRRNCGDIRHLALGSNYAFVYASDVEREIDSASALIQVSPDTGRVDPLYVSGITVGNYIASDIGLQGRILCVDGDAPYFIATKEGSSQIYKLSASGEPLCPILDPGSTEQLNVRTGWIVFTGLCRDSCQEVYILEDREQMISHLHGNDTSPFYPMVEIPCHGIQGWALREETEEKTCPAVISLHDGPQRAFGKVYYLGMQLLAQNDYVVLFANLPDSMGYGEDFSMLDEHLGDDDYNDLIRFPDAVLDAYSEIDPNRLAVIGTGYGAYLAAAAMEKCNHFGAATCDGAISNCVSMISISDHDIAFAEKQMKACAFKQTGELWKCSPLSRIASMETSTLLLHGENDRSSHLSQGQMFFTALKIHGVPAGLRVFPGENHSLVSKGTPLTRDRHHTEILWWLKMYL